MYDPVKVIKSFRRLLEVKEWKKSWVAMSPEGQNGKSDVGIKILPKKKLQSRMSSGVSYYEGELYNVIRQGHGDSKVEF